MTRPTIRDPIYRGRVFDADIIELCVRWYITYRLSYPDVVAMMALECEFSFTRAPGCETARENGFATYSLPGPRESVAGTRWPAIPTFAIRAPGVPSGRLYRLLRQRKMPLADNVLDFISISAAMGVALERSRGDELGVPIARVVGLGFPWFIGVFCAYSIVRRVHWASADVHGARRGKFPADHSEVQARPDLRTEAHLRCRSDPWAVPTDSPLMAQLSPPGRSTSEARFCDQSHGEGQACRPASRHEDSRCSSRRDCLGKLRNDCS